MATSEQLRIAAEFAEAPGHAFLALLYIRAQGIHVRILDRVVPHGDCLNRIFSWQELELAEPNFWLRNRIMDMMMEFDAKKRVAKAQREAFRAQAEKVENGN